MAKPVRQFLPFPLPFPPLPFPLLPFPPLPFPLLPLPLLFPVRRSASCPLFPGWSSIVDVVRVDEGTLDEVDVDVDVELVETGAMPEATVVVVDACFLPQSLFAASARLPLGCAATYAP